MVPRIIFAFLLALVALLALPSDTAVIQELVKGTSALTEAAARYLDALRRANPPEPKLISSSSPDLSDISRDIAVQNKDRDQGNDGHRHRTPTQGQNGDQAGQ